MRALTGTLLEQHYSESKEPHYVIEIAFDDAATDLAYFSSHIDTAVPGGAVVFAGSVQKISSTSQKITPEQGRSTIGSFSVDLLDLAGAVTTLFKAKDIADIGLRQRRVRAFMGYAGMSWAEIYANPIQTQIIDGLDEEKGFYRLRCADIQRVTRKKIFQKAKTRLSQTIDSAQLLIPVLSVDSFSVVAHGNSYTDAPNASVGYIKIESEVIRWIGTVVDPSFGLSFVADKRGALNTLPAVHEVSVEDTDDRGQEAAEFVYLEMPAAKLAYALLTGELLGQSGEVLPLNWHAGVDTKYVRDANFSNIGVDLYNPATDEGLIVRFAGEAEQDGKRFIETQICLLLGCFMPIYSDGQMGLKRFSNVLHQSPYVFELNEDNVVSHGSLKVDMRGVRNLLSVQWNYDFIREKLTRQKILVDDVSRLKHKDAPATSLSFRGLHGSRHTSTTLEGLFDRLRDRYAGPPLTLSIKGLPLTNILEIGDVVRVRLPGVTDYQLGGDIDRSMEVQSGSINWDDGSVSFEMLGSSEGATLINSVSGGLGNVLPDNWYTSAGTDLATYPGITLTESGGVGHITAGTIAGGGTFEQGRFFYDGDLQIDAGAEVFLENNVLFAVKGFFQVNGKINGKGRGLQALPPIELSADDDLANGAAVLEDRWGQHASGVAGYIGPTVSAGGLLFWVHYFGITKLTSLAGFLTPGKVSTVPVFNISYDVELLGLPLSMAGTAGAQGRASCFKIANDKRVREWAGGMGGNGGAGLVIASQGAALGVAGVIDVSGADGVRADPVFVTNGNPAWDYMYPGSGAGGAPGAVLFLIDGLLNTVPDIQFIVAKFGVTPYPIIVNSAAGLPNGMHQLTAPVVDDAGYEALPENAALFSYYWGYAESPPDLSGFNGAARVQFIPPNLTTVEDEPSIFDGFYELPVLNNLQLVSGTATLLAAVDGSIQERIQANWNVTTDSYADGYEVQYRVLGGAWQTSSVIIDIEAPLSFVDVTEGQAYQVRIRAYSNRVTVRPSAWLQAPDHIAQGKSVAPTNPTGFVVAIQSDTGAVFNVGAHPDLDFKQYLFYQGPTFATATFLFNASSVKSLSGPIASTDELKFWVVAEDRTGNLSGAVSAVAAVNNPSPVVPALSYVGADALIRWAIPSSVFSIDYYESSINSAVVFESKSTTLKINVSWLAAQTISIVAVDIAGNRSAVTDVVVNPALPAAPVLTALKTAANQFKLVYSAVAGDLPIDAYVVSVGSFVAPVEVLEKAGSSTFTTISEETGGDYDYFVQARDTAGNISAAGAITVRLENSTDLSLILTDSQSSSNFSGTRTNILETDGDLILPVPDGRLWQDKYSSYATIQAKIDAGFPEFLQPSAASATYVFTVDVGAVIAQATAQVLISLEQVVGTVTAAVSLEQSDDDVTYTSITTVSGAGQAIAFRYIRATVTFAPSATTDMAKLLQISTTILTIAREESGTFTSTALAGGDVVTLDQQFADIQTIIFTANGVQIEANPSWVDPNPTQFKAQIFVAGTATRYLGQVGYTIKGV